MLIGLVSDFNNPFIRLISKQTRPPSHPLISAHTRRLSPRSRQLLFSCGSSAKMAPTPILLSSEQIKKSNIRLSSQESAFREGSATIVLPSKEAAFLNPVQEFNRDISTLAIITWSQINDEAAKQRWLIRQAAKRSTNGKGKARKANKRAKVDQESGKDIIPTGQDPIPPDTEASHTHDSRPQPVWRPQKFTLFEALAATGLRSIRYANEIPLVKWILANDLSPTAVSAMRRNVALNFPATGQPIPPWTPEMQSEPSISTSHDEPEPNPTPTHQPQEDEIQELENGARSTSTRLVKDEAGESQDKSRLSSGNELQHSSDSKKTQTPMTEAIDAKGKSKQTDPQSSSSSHSSSSLSNDVSIHPECKIKISQADATSVLYSHRSLSEQFDVIDLDPYGSAVPFLDGAIQSVSDNGLLCVTCTDLAVLAGHNYPEKAYSAYGGVSGKAEYVHEIALRLLLHSIEMTAARYGRVIQPLLSLSIDFYVRVFLKVRTSPKDVKDVASRNGIVNVCSGCGDFREQRFGKSTPANEGSTNLKYTSATANEVPANCPECHSRYHITGPLYLGPMHDKSFCDSMVEVLERAPKRFGTAGRIRGMVGLASDELDTLFYFTPTKLAGSFHCTCPAMSTVISAILHAGYQASRSHCSPGSIKTTAPRAFIYDLFRTFIALPGNSVNMSKISETSPSYHLNNKPLDSRVFGEIKIGPKVDEHPETKRVLNGTITSSSKDGVVGTRYQMNPLPNWGPGVAAKGHTGKRKREVNGEEEQVSDKEKRKEGE